MNLGNIIEQRQIDVILEDGDFIEDVIVVASVSRADGSRNLIVASEESGNWIKEYGMLQVAAKMVGGDEG